MSRKTLPTKLGLFPLMTSCLILAGSITGLARATENIDPTMAKAALPGILSNLNKLANDQASEENCKQRMALVYKYQKFAASVKQNPLSQKELNNHFLKNCIEASVSQEPKRSRSRDLVDSAKSKLRGSKEGKSSSTTEPTAPTRPVQPTPTHTGQAVPPRPTRALPQPAQQAVESKPPSRRQALIGSNRGQAPKTSQVGGPPEDLPPPFPGDRPPQDMPPPFLGDAHHQQQPEPQPVTTDEESPKPGTLAWQLQQKKAQGLNKATSGTTATGQASTQQGQSASSVPTEAEKQAPQTSSNPMFAEMQKKQAERAKRLSQSGGVAIQAEPSPQYTLTANDIARLKRRMAIEGDEEFKESLESQLSKAQKEQDKMKVAQLSAELAFVTQQM